MVAAQDSLNNIQYLKTKTQPWEMTSNVLNSSIIQNYNHTGNLLKPISLWIKEAYKFLGIVQCYSSSNG